MKVLLTGASGFLGRYVLTRLEGLGIDTVVVGRRMPNDWNEINFRRVDLLAIPDFDELVDDIGATHLLHLAWYAEHGLFWHSPKNLWWSQATVRLVDAFCRLGGQKVVIAGTCAEYDWSHGYCVEEVTPANPLTMYGVAKDATRRLAQATCASYNVDCAWGRVFLPYGHGEDSRRLLPSLAAVFQGKCAPFGVNASAYRDFLHAKDVAAAFVTLLEAPAVGLFNICSGQPLQLSQLVRQIAQVHGADPRIVLDLTSKRTGEPDFLVGSNQRLKALGWHAQHSSDSILAKADK